MKRLKKDLFMLLMTCLIGLWGNTVFALIDCPFGTAVNSIPHKDIVERINRISVVPSQWTTSTSIITFGSLSQVIDCSSYFPNGNGNANRPRYKQTLFELMGSSIDWGSYIDYGGNRYLKLMNTGNLFLDQHGYITFKLTYSGEYNFTSGVTKDISVSSAGTLELLNLIMANAATREGATQSLQVSDLRFYFTSSPGAQVVGSITMGTLVLNLGNIDNASTITHSGRRNYTINLTLNPEAGKTCIVSANPSIVTLPTVSTNSLSTAGSEAGRTNFTMTATCDGLASTVLYYSMSDNSSLANNTDILTNTIAATNNVGIKIYDANTHAAITYDNEATFGTLPNSSPSSVSKNFYAKYYKKDANPVSGGGVSAQATILVVYK